MLVKGATVIGCQFQQAPAFRWGASFYLPCIYHFKRSCTDFSNTICFHFVIPWVLKACGLQHRCNILWCHPSNYGIFHQSTHLFTENAELLWCQPCHQWRHHRLPLWPPVPSVTTNLSPGQLPVFSICALFLVRLHTQFLIYFMYLLIFSWFLCRCWWSQSQLRIRGAYG